LQIKQLCEEYSQASATMVTRQTVQILGRLMYNLRECSAQDIIQVIKSYGQQTNSRAL
jgi:flavorubredoxin